MTRIFRYCRWDEIAAAERAGWVVAARCPGHHQAYSVIVEWLCACPPVSWSRVR